MPTSRSYTMPIHTVVEDAIRGMGLAHVGVQVEARQMEEPVYGANDGLGFSPRRDSRIEVRLELGGLTTTIQITDRELQQTMADPRQVIAGRIQSAVAELTTRTGFYTTLRSPTAAFPPTDFEDFTRAATPNAFEFLAFLDRQVGKALLPQILIGGPLKPDHPKVGPPMTCWSLIDSDED